MAADSIIPQIIDQVKKARTTDVFNREIPSDGEATGKNEFLFFIKPELTLDDSDIKLEKILKLIFSKFVEFSFKIINTRVINAAYLKKHNIIAQHYGVINQLSKDIKSTISEEAKVKFEEIFQESFEQAEVFGGIEFIEKYSFFSPKALSVLWQNSPTEKLAGGTYAQKLSIDGKTTFLINGFHPRQLEHFTAPGRSIIVMTLTSHADWSVARNKLIGKTNPAEAIPGSIRRELLERKTEFGLQEISSSWNGVHLSAGPVEGLVELIRYNSDHERNKVADTSDYNFGATLLKAMGPEITDKIFSNPTLNYNGKAVSVFDLTEEMNTDDCIDLLKKLFP